MSDEYCFFFFLFIIIFAYYYTQPTNFLKLYNIGDIGVFNLNVRCGQGLTG